MTVINRQPTGWLGFLGIKNFGRNPSTAADVLAPTWDLSQLYLSANRQLVEITETINGNGSYPQVTVPPGQVWYLESWSFIGAGVLGAGGVASLKPMLYNTALGYSVLLGGSSGRIVAGAILTVSSLTPIILQSGDAFGFYCYEFAGAAVPGNVAYAYTRLDA